MTVKVQEDVRCFEYTRQQWTGKSPKQFLIDWCRKHLPKSPPPKFEKISHRANKFKCKYVQAFVATALASRSDVGVDVRQCHWHDGCGSCCQQCLSTMFSSIS